MSTTGKPTFSAAIEWIALNDGDAGNEDFPVISESLVADLFGTTPEYVASCVRRASAYFCKGMQPPRMKMMTSRMRREAARGAA